MRTLSSCCLAAALIALSACSSKPGPVEEPTQTPTTLPPDTTPASKTETTTPPPETKPAEPAEPVAKADPCRDLVPPEGKLEKPDYDSGRTAWKCANDASKAGKHEVARRFFLLAHQFTNDPTLYFWVADSSLKAGDCQAAVIYYKQYLIDGNPDDANRQSTEQGLAKCGAEVKAPPKP